MVSEHHDILPELFHLVLSRPVSDGVKVPALMMHIEVGLLPCRDIWIHCHEVRRNIAIAHERQAQSFQTVVNVCSLGLFRSVEKSFWEDIVMVTPSVLSNKVLYRLR